MIDFTRRDLEKIETTVRVYKDLRSHARRLRLRAWHETPESEEWQTYRLVDSIGVAIDLEDWLEVALYLPKAVRLVNELDSRAY